MSDALPLAVALGEPAGVGPEITAKAWVARHSAKLSPFCVIGDMRAIEAVWRGPLQQIEAPSDAIGVFDRALPVLNIEDGGPITPGIPNVEGARCAIDSLEMALGITRSGATRAIV